MKAQCEIHQERRTREATRKNRRGKSTEELDVKTETPKNWDGVSGY